MTPSIQKRKPKHIKRLFVIEFFLAFFVFLCLTQTAAIEDLRGIRSRLFLHPTIFILLNRLPQQQKGRRTEGRKEKRNKQKKDPPSNIFIFLVILSIPMRDVQQSLRLFICGLIQAEQSTQSAQYHQWNPQRSSSRRVHCGVATEATCPQREGTKERQKEREELKIAVPSARDVDTRIA